MATPSRKRKPSKDFIPSSSPDSDVSDEQAAIDVTTTPVRIKKTYKTYSPLAEVLIRAGITGDVGAKVATATNMYNVIAAREMWYEVVTADKLARSMKFTTLKTFKEGPAVLSHK